MGGGIACLMLILGGGAMRGRRRMVEVVVGMVDEGLR